MMLASLISIHILCLVSFVMSIDERNPLRRLERIMGRIVFSARHSRLEPDQQ